MKTLAVHAKFAGASGLATATDAAVFAVGTLTFGVSPIWSATSALLAAVAGAVVHFLLCRHLVFSDTSPVGESALRYAGVSATTAALHGTTVAGLVALDASAAVAWATAKVAVYLCWSFPASRHLVFERS